MALGVLIHAFSRKNMHVLITCDLSTFRSVLHTVTPSKIDALVKYLACNFNKRCFCYLVIIYLIIPSFTKHNFIAVLPP